ncbi:hypothetical protein CAPTEDRAFT_200459 [Capitella teleta]|uniref:Pantothenate kinase 4 n=1 Tax=Capitella teleta TaxID=283909 RepID=R7TNX4_CAPTE|nr:hypothetical protein CAPTEDRAFT_200459 [Capitella teleta]|eukprot:ELT95593.1 hypothetical protein CAPTEDRAFT_200459 [Capitella teleta]
MVFFAHSSLAQFATCDRFCRGRSHICFNRPKIITEHDCFAKCFHFLSHGLSRDQLLHPIPYDAMEHPLGFCEELHSLLKLMNANKISKVHDLEMVEKLEEAVREVRNTDFVNLPKDSRPLAEAEDIFPCLLAINGSTFNGFIVNKDASFQYLDATQLGGRFFHGLGSLLTGCKTYEELIEMAAKGNHKKLDTHKNDMLFDTGEDDLVAKFRDTKVDSLVFNFGKAVGKTAGDFEPADIASALLRGFVKEKAERCRLVASLHDLKSIFFVGSFVNHEIVRKVYTEMFTFSNYFIDAVHRKKIAISKYDFVKNGSHFGALGCLINTLDLFI